MNIFASYGAATGILVGLIIAVILFKFANTNHRTKTEYDERQKVIRGQAYMYGFYTIVVYECLMMVLSIGRLDLPVQEYMLHFAGVLLGCMVVGIYSIWHGVYWGLNNNRRRYVIIFAVCALLNAFPVIGALRSGTLMADGKPALPVVNLMVLIMLLVLGIELLIKQVADSRAESED